MEAPAGGGRGQVGVCGWPSAEGHASALRGRGLASKALPARQRPVSLISSAFRQATLFTLKNEELVVEPSLR